METSMTTVHVAVAAAEVVVEDLKGISVKEALATINVMKGK